ncbi:MAG: transposase [Dehalogenimonas sp.]|uniref:Transposase n=1 Tax=Candidatus Dehalogenimonas loeffleri TaxID=3127115 RepID=A0ABZ2JB25_9CHLR|nr:transposase [Dehalogenimonas sp.]
MNKPTRIKTESFPVRKNTRLKEYDYSTAAVYFITVCVQDKKCLFGEVTDGTITVSALGTMTEQCWKDIIKHSPDIEIDEWVVMPNHFHGIVHIPDITGRARHASPLQHPAPRRTVVGTVIGSFKSAVTRRLKQDGLISASVWQRGYYEHVVRNEEDLARIREYIAWNPARWTDDPEYHEGDIQ